MMERDPLLLAVAEKKPSDDWLRLRIRENNKTPVNETVYDIPLRLITSIVINSTNKTYYHLVTGDCGPFFNEKITSDYIEKLRSLGIKVFCNRNLSCC